jgi:cysteine-rich repeat protein
VCVVEGECLRVDGDVFLAREDGSACAGGHCVQGACSVARCGDGFRAEDEACDDGNSDDTDGCVQCAAAFCGDGAVFSGVEECDDGNGVDGDGCDAGCVVSSCGNDIVGIDEECDDGNTINDDGCTNACTRAACGDGIVQAGEACDDGNAIDDDGCHQCRIDQCGDGVLYAAVESCDDGNTRSGDGCRSDCKKAEVCGDQVLDVGEECDDGNTNPRDGCDRCRLQRFRATLVLGQEGEQPDSVGIALAVGAAGEVYFVSQVDASFASVDVVSVARDGRVERAWGDGTFGVGAVGVPPTATATRAIGRIAVDPVGRLWVSEDGNGGRRIGLSGNVEQVEGGFEVLDALGRRWVHGFFGPLTLLTNPPQTFSIARAPGFVSFGVDALGRAWVPDDNGEVHLFDSRLPQNLQVSLTAPTPIARISSSPVG